MDFVKRVEQRAAMSCDTVLKIFYQTCRGVQHMHKQKPTIIHRDLKVGGPTGGGPPRVGGWPGGAGLGGLAWGGWPGESGALVQPGHLHALAFWLSRNSSPVKSLS